MLPDLAKALSREWQRANEAVFGGALLQAPAIEVSDRVRHRAGSWEPATRTIQFSRHFVAERPWLTVVEVLKHEMAHQYVSDVLGIEDEETAHGPAFQMVCARFGIDGRARHKPTARESGLVDRARKLLALASSPNQNEAEAALAGLQRILGRHGLSEDDVRERQEDQFGAAPLGPIIKKRQLHHSIVSALLGRHFRVRPIWIHTDDPRSEIEGLQLEVVGQRCDVAMAEHVHGWLHGLAERLCPPDLSGKRRLDFLAGVMSGHMDRLDHEASTAKASANGTSLSMMKVDAADADLDDYFERRYPHTRKTGGRGRKLTGSFFEGREQGRASAMSKPLDGAAGSGLLGR
jgi:SprT-like family protein/uncharacterized protein DUF2786